MFKVVDDLCIRLSQSTKEEFKQDNFFPILPSLISRNLPKRNLNFKVYIGKPLELNLSQSTKEEFKLANISPGLLCQERSQSTKEEFKL